MSVDARTLTTPNLLAGGDECVELTEMMGEWRLGQEEKGETVYNEEHMTSRWNWWAGEQSDVVDECRLLSRQNFT